MYTYIYDCTHTGSGEVSAVGAVSLAMATEIPAIHHPGWCPHITPPFCLHGLGQAALSAMAAEIPAIHHTEGAPTSAFSGPRVQRPTLVAESPASNQPCPLMLAAC